MVYEWKIPKYPVSAQVAGEVLSEIEGRYGGITPKILVEESRDAKSPLHPCFTWDDKKAAEKCRQGEAGAIIRNLVVVAIRDPNSGEEAPPVRAFVSLTDDYDSKTKYFTMEVAIRDVDGRNQVLSDALKEAQSYKQKWSHLHEVSQIIDAIDRVTQSL